MPPRYPIYVISKGRFKNCLTAKFLKKDGVPFSLVVEPQEADEYRSRYGDEYVKVLPFSNLGLGSIPARNWCWEDAKKNGYKRHWILDDNIRSVKRRYKAERLKCNSGPAFEALEDFTDRYLNIGILGMNYTMFCRDRATYKPFFLNVHVYSCLLILNDLPFRWRGRYNEDTDLCLQVLSSGLCTVLTNAFLIDKMQTMKLKGGNSDQLYQGDGRLKMARSLEKAWPYVVKTDRRWRRPQHVVKDDWKWFDTPLLRDPSIDWSKLDKPNEYGLNLKKTGEDIKSPKLNKIYKAYHSERA